LPDSSVGYIQVHTPAKQLYKSL